MPLEFADVPRSTFHAQLSAFFTRWSQGAIRATVVHVDGTRIVTVDIYRNGADRQPVASAHALCSAGVDLRADERSLRVAQRRATRRALRAACIASEASLLPSAARSATRPGDPYVSPARRLQPSFPPPPPGLRERLADLDALIAACVRRGLRLARATRWRRQLRTLRDGSAETFAALDRVERRLRLWMARGEPV